MCSISSIYIYISSNNSGFETGILVIGFGINVWLNYPYLSTSDEEVGFDHLDTIYYQNVLLEL